MDPYDCRNVPDFLFNYYYCKIGDFDPRKGRFKQKNEKMCNLTVFGICLKICFLQAYFKVYRGLGLDLILDYQHLSSLRCGMILLYVIETVPWTNETNSKNRAEPFDTIVSVSKI